MNGIMPTLNFAVVKQLFAVSILALLVIAGGLRRSCAHRNHRFYAGAGAYPNCCPDTDAYPNRRPNANAHAYRRSNAGGRAGACRYRRADRMDPVRPFRVRVDTSSGGLPGPGGRQHQNRGQRAPRHFTG